MTTETTAQVQYNDTCNNGGPGYRVTVNTMYGSYATICATPEAAADYVRERVFDDINRRDHARTLFAGAA